MYPKNTHLKRTYFPYLEPPPEVCGPNTQAVAGRAAAVRLARAAWRPKPATVCVYSLGTPRQATRAGIPVRDRSTPSLCRTPPSCRLSPAVAPAAPHTSCSRLCSWTWRGLSRTDPVRRAAHVCAGKRRGSRALGRTVSRSSPCSCRAVKAESLIEGGSGRSTTEVSTSSHVGPKNFSLHTHACATQTPLPPHGRPIASVGQSRSCSQRSPP